MSKREYSLLRDDEISEYLGNDNLSDFSGVDCDVGLDDEVDLSCDILFQNLTFLYFLKYIKHV